MYIAIQTENFKRPKTPKMTLALSGHQRSCLHPPPMMAFNRMRAQIERAGFRVVVGPADRSKAIYLKEDKLAEQSVPLL